MLLELDVRDFAIIERLRLRLTPGFNVLTGETGAGKSIIVDAVGLLLGDRADTDMVRAGAERAVIEALFEPDATKEAVDSVLGAYGVEPDDELIVTREIYSAGRSTSRLNGRAVPLKALVELGRLLVDVHGQSDNASLKREVGHLDLLDRYGDLGADRAALAERVARAAEVDGELRRLQRDEAELARRADMLAYQVEEIAAARISPNEEAALLDERKRLANAERLAALADGAYAALRGETLDASGALDLVERAVEALAALARIDPALEPQSEALAGAGVTVGDVASHVLAYRDRVEFSPERLEEVETRLGVIVDLKRKYGPDVAAVLAWAERAATELADIGGAEERIAELTGDHARLLAEIGGLAGSLSARRREAGERLARAAELELEALGMSGSHFEVEIERQADPSGAPVDGVRFAFGPSGIDGVRFLVSANPGEPPRALARVASGGETARIMLALKNILTAADDVPTLIFDEIDAGIGGRVGAVVGEKLWQLSDRHQVLCVTHLPQVAAYGDSHFQVHKAIVDDRTVTDVATLVDEARVDEINHMLGTPTRAGRESAQQLLQQTELWKVTARHARESA